VAANDAGTGGITVIDEYTVKLSLEAPYAPWVYILAGSWCSIVSPTYVEANGGVVVGSHNDWMDEHTCGTGPYMVTSWVVDEQITMDRYENYWREAEAKAQYPFAGSIDKIISKTNEDISSSIINFMGDEAHEIYVPTTHATEFYNFAEPPAFDTYDGRSQSKDPSQYKIWAAFPQYTIAEIHFTMSETMNETTLNRVVENPYALKNVRKALCYVFNYTAEIYDINNGIASGKGSSSNWNVWSL
jgi:ABC-type transport system substrate-binding protein